VLRRNALPPCLPQCLLWCALLCPPAFSAALAQEFPAKPIRLILPFPAGGLSDVLGNALRARLTASMGQPIVMENRPGAGSTLAADLVAKSAPDGYTLLLQDLAAHSANATLFPKLPYDSVKDFTQVALVSASPLMLVVLPDFQAKNVRELIALGKARPGEFNYASPGNGTLPHLVAEAFKKQAGANFVHVPYKGGTALAVLSREVAMTFAVIPLVLSQVKAGKLSALGVTSAKRIAAAPDVPTMAEAGVPNLEFMIYTGVLGPKGLPRPVLAKLNAETAKAVASAEMQATLATIGAEGASGTPEEFTRHLVAEIEKFRRAVNESGAKLD
jgi:tripartite-type tricarboxylate transporter receptor subunit TctC